MKNGTAYGKRIRFLFHKLRSAAGKVTGSAGATEPVPQLLHALLSVDSTPNNAAKALDSLFRTMVDINEIRVSSPHEIAAHIGDFVPDARDTAERCHHALNDIFRKTNGLSLHHLGSLGRREARQFLDEIDGVDPFSAASVMLWSLGGHAVPIDHRVLKVLRRAEFVDPDATQAEVQAFLERHIQAQEAREFCTLIQKLTLTKATQVAQARGIPPAPPRRMTVAKPPAARAPMSR